MPVSKRNKIVSLTKTGSKGKQLKSKMIEVLRAAVDEYARVYVFSFNNLRSTKFREVRMHFKESKIFMGKNSVAQIALGKTTEDEYKDNLKNVSKLLEGNVGLLFTSRADEEILDYFQNYDHPEYAKAGAIPDETVVIPAGELVFPVSMLDELRKLGLIVEVDNGKLTLREPYTAAAVGTPLTPEQARILVKLEKPIISFTIKLLCRWEDNEYHEL